MLEKYSSIFTVPTELWRVHSVSNRLRSLSGYLVSARIDGVSVITINADGPGETAIFWADVVPTAHHVQPPYIMAYDIDVVRSFESRSSWLERASEGGWIGLFYHDPDHAFGPYGLSYADDRWELRNAIKIRFVPRNSDHPYHHKDIYIDKNSMEPLYSFAYDRKEELWKIIWHNHRWSEDDESFYQGWEGVPKPMDLRVVSDTIVNVQTGTGNRIEFWDNDGTPLKSKGKIRRYIDIGRLTKGR